MTKIRCLQVLLVLCGINVVVQVLLLLHYFGVL